MDERRSERIRTAYRLSVNVINRLGERLPPDRAEFLRTLIGVGEYELFFETVCGALIARRIPVTPAEAADISALGRAVDGTASVTGRYLSELVVRNDAGVPPPDTPPALVVRPPAGFYQMSEADQLAWARQVGAAMEEEAG